MALDVDTILDIVKDILPNLADGGLNSHEDLDVRLLIHQSRAGCVIGKGGSKIKELRDKTGAKLKIFSNPAPQSAERVVQLIGNPDAVAAGVREVLDIIRQVPIKGPVQNYDPHNYDDFYADEYGGFGGGGGGRGPSRGGPRGAPGSRAPPPARAPPPRGPPGRGPPPGPTGGPRGFGGNEFGGPPPRGNFGNAPRAGNFGGFAGNFGDGGQKTSTQVTIPKDLAGAIIGKAGSRIRKIRVESGASIEIAAPLPNSSDRIITITGTPARIQKAQYLLQQSVHESNPHLGRGNF